MEESKRAIDMDYVLEIFKMFGTKTESIFLILCILVIIISFTLVLFIIKKSSSRAKITLNSIENNNQEILNYLMVYIIPFISINTSNSKDIIIFFILFAVIGGISVKNNMIYINPIIYLLNYNIFKFNNDNIVITKKSKVDILRGEFSEHFYKLSEKFYILK